MMAAKVFQASTLDDAMHDVFEWIRSNGEAVTATKGSTLEITGAVVEITNPLARLSRTDTRGRAFSCLGELCWYLAGADDEEFIAYYVAKYREFAEDGRLFGAYGPRLFRHNELDQIANVTRILREKPTSRQAVVQLFDASDVAQRHLDVPCTCTLQFLLRQGRLRMIVNMRSNDAYLGLPHDVFCFTMLQEIVARELGVELGLYTHMVGSLHLYNENLPEVDDYLGEGWQSTTQAMPPMPADAWSGVRVLLAAEREIRRGRSFDEATLAGVHSYWADLIRLLLIHRCVKEKDLGTVVRLRGDMNKFYFPLVDRRMRA